MVSKCPKLILTLNLIDKSCFHEPALLYTNTPTSGTQNRASILLISRCVRNPDLWDRTGSQKSLHQRCEKFRFPLLANADLETTVYVLVDTSGPMGGSGVDGLGQRAILLSRAVTYGLTAESNASLSHSDLGIPPFI